MIGQFDIPCVDGLVEGRDYTVLEWDFATSQPVQQPPAGSPCPPGTKMIWGLCRRVDSSGNQQVGKETDEERKLKQTASGQGSSVQNNKPVSVAGKKFGWAIKGGKPILVSWGSVAGTGKAAPKKGKMN